MVLKDEGLTVDVFVMKALVVYDSISVNMRFGTPEPGRRLKGCCSFLLVSVPQDKTRASIGKRNGAR